MPLPTIPSGNVASATASTGYDVANSCRFNDGDSAYLTRDLGTSTAGSGKKFTFSAWVKRGILGTTQYLFSSSVSTHQAYLSFESDNTLRFRLIYGGTTYGDLITNAVFRDPTAWLHIVVNMDTTQSTDTNRTKMYVNGSQITNFSTSTRPNQDSTFTVNNNTANNQDFSFGRDENGDGSYFDGYMAEVVWIDGTAYAASNFGEYDEDSPQIWKPKDFKDDVTFGTHGVYLDFEDSGDLDDDESGNGNDFTATNLASTDQSTDTCTNNFSTFNPLIPNTVIIYQEGNLKVNQASNSSYTTAWSTIAVSQGKWYAEFKAVSGFDNIAKAIGFLDVDSAYDDDAHIEAYSNGGAYGANGRVVQNGSGATSYTTYTNGDIIGIALDLDNGKVYYHKNGTYINSGVPTSGSTGTGAFTVNTGKSYIFSAVIINFGGSNIWEANFGSPSFAISSGNSDGNGYGNMEYSVPSGYYTLCTKNLADYG